ncbi:MAG TPA: hypothetical protein VNR64_10125, partial [Vicinamibacterales bacterium]|nr:hypothetical protein [Vicinamibacterales bacterium]
MKGLGWFTAAVVALTTIAVAAQTTAPQPQSRASMSVDQVIATWKPTPKDVAQKMIAKYGQPQEITSNRLVWHNSGPWK